MTVHINPDRLLADLRTLSGFGKVGTGVDRTAFTAQDLAARYWLAERMRDAGLDASLDRIGTVHGRGGARVVLIGSHSDTVPMGGWLDGALGVIYGLEIARAMAEAGYPGAVDVVAFQDEEGTFVPCMGSKSFCGLLEEADLMNAESLDGRRMTDILPVPDLPQTQHRIEPDRQIAYLEAHIEQGPRLEAAKVGIGVVTGIAGIRRFQIKAEGRADHAGTTPTSMRRDAGAALLTLGAALLNGFPRWGYADTVWNIGKIVFRPGAANVVPELAEMIVEFRDLSEELLDKIEAEMMALATAYSGHFGATITTTPIGSVVAVQTTGALQDILAGAAARLSVPAMRMASGAGHDAMIMARQLPTGMLFVPSIGGRSHDVTENTGDADIVRGCQVLATATEMLWKSNGGTSQ